jgi:hypothetical protein
MHRQRAALPMVETNSALEYLKWRGFLSFGIENIEISEDFRRSQSEMFEMAGDLKLWPPGRSSERAKFFLIRWNMWNIGRFLMERG